MLTHEQVAIEWEKDYPKPKDVVSQIENIAEITLVFENLLNKYWDYYYIAERQHLKSLREFKKIENTLRLYFSKRPIEDSLIENLKLEPLQVQYTKNEIDLMVKTHDVYAKWEEKVRDDEILIDRLKDYLKFIQTWKFNQKNFIEIFKFTNGYVRD